MAVLQLVMVLGMMFYVSTSLTLVGLAPLPFLAGGALSDFTSASDGIR